MDMLERAVFSLNKRAKNCRDKKNEYYKKAKDSRNVRYFYNVEKYKQKEIEYYEQKNSLLSKLLKPLCIHEQNIIQQRKVRYYDYEEEFSLLQDVAINKSDYFDRDIRDYIEFIDVLEEENIKNYYLFYKTNNYSFHIPVAQEEVDKLSKNKLSIIPINNFQTYGCEIAGLLSAQFVTKIVELIETEEYKFVQ